jgi:hypothetical protein
MGAYFLTNFKGGQEREKRAIFAAVNLPEAFLGRRERVCSCSLFPLAAGAALWARIV